MIKKSGLWNFGNESSHTDNRKNNFLVLGQGSTYDIYGSFGPPEKKFNINFVRANITFCLSLQFTLQS